MMRIAPVILSVCLALTAHAPAGAQQIGTGAAVRGDVVLTPAARPTPRPARSGDAIALADRVQTRPDSGMQVLLLDRSVFTIGANADLTIDRFVYDPDRDAGDVAASVARGAFRFVSGRAANRGTVATIATPAGTIGVRGTILEGWVGERAIAAARASGVDVPAGTDPSRALYVALRGPEGLGGRGGQIVVQGANGRQVLTRPNQAVFASGTSGRVSAPVRYADGARAFFDGTLRTDPGGTSGGGALPADLELSIPSAPPPRIDDLAVPPAPSPTDETVDGRFPSEITPPPPPPPGAGGGGGSVTTLVGQ
ncbi:FecR domain-containing protein [Jannaschia sp. LMIT008]|uniref:FecR family protein n=1 Tax=Jannaschia maritima TaxID=3032585 RepID=UPI002810F9CE|nr:FecR domain-containing protein [Jannaschia sp. LMIT008]